MYIEPTECPKNFHVTTESITAITNDVSFDMRWPANWPVEKLIEAAEKMQLCRDAQIALVAWNDLSRVMDFYGEDFDDVVVHAKRTKAIFTPDTEDTVVG